MDIRPVTPETWDSFVEVARRSETRPLMRLELT